MSCAYFDRNLGLEGRVMKSDVILFDLILENDFDIYLLENNDC